MKCGVSINLQGRGSVLQFFKTIRKCFFCSKTLQYRKMPQDLCRFPGEVLRLNLGQRHQISKVSFAVHQTFLGTKIQQVKSKMAAKTTKNWLISWYFLIPGFFWKGIKFYFTQNVSFCKPQLLHYHFSSNLSLFGDSRG